MRLHVGGIFNYGYNYIFRDQTKINQTKQTDRQRQTDSGCTKQTRSHFRENKITAAINSSRNSSHLCDMKETIKGPSFDLLHLQPKSPAEVPASAGPVQYVFVFYMQSLLGCLLGGCCRGSSQLIYISKKGD